jgi:hypothetical protein
MPQLDTMEAPHTRDDAAEWRKLERERDILLGQGKLVACAPSFLNRPHPLSYGADLPMRSEYYRASLLKTTKAERAEYASRPVKLRPVDVSMCSGRAVASRSLSSPRKLDAVRKRLPELSIIPLPSV